MGLNLELDCERFTTLLTKLIGESQHVQNNPPKFVPQEGKVVAHILEALKPYSIEEGGVLKVETHEYIEGRPNMLITYNSAAAETGGTCAFVGSHLDVVPANPETWEVDPFQLTIKGDQMFGRGTTDCLGHVAMITDMLITLATLKPELKVAVVVCFIASEESTAIQDVGVDMLVKEGKLEHLKKGPVFWCDSADSQPCIGTAAAIQWNLKAGALNFPSGFSACPLSACCSADLRWPPMLLPPPCCSQLATFSTLACPTKGLTLSNSARRLSPRSRGDSTPISPRTRRRRCTRFRPRRR